MGRDTSGEVAWRNAADEEELLALRLAGYERELRPFEPQAFGQGFHHRIVRLAFLGDLRDGDLQPAIVLASNAGGACSRLSTDGQ